MKRSRRLVNQAKSLSATDLRHFLLHSQLPHSVDYQFDLCHAAQLTTEHQAQIIELFEMNMKSLYEQSSDGYDRDGKRQELFSDQARYLLIFTANDLLAFAHFRFDMDYGSRVLYLYEFQVNRKCQGQGLGQWMMQQLKILCRETQMSKIVLTVHKVNKKAIDFYVQKCLFESDSTDPSDEDVDYVILSFSV